MTIDLLDESETSPVQLPVHDHHGLLSLTTEEFDCLTLRVTLDPAVHALLPDGLDQLAIVMKQVVEDSGRCGDPGNNGQVVLKITLKLN